MKIVFLTEILTLILGSCMPLQRTSEAKLVQDLLRRLREVHNRHVIPKNVTSRCKQVKFGLRLVQVSLSEKQNVMETSMWVRYKWEDEFLKWNKQDYDNISRIVIPTHKIWLPDISLVNTEETFVNERHSNGASVQSSGVVFWPVHRHYRSACLVDLTNYPFDSHVCDLWFQSLVYRDEDLCLQKYGPSPPFDLETYLTSFKQSGEWLLSENKSDIVPIPRDVGAILVFSRRRSLLFCIKLTRQAGFTAYLLMIPPLLLSALTIIVFFLPPERPDRNALATSLFASFMVLLLVLVQSAPASAASVPKLGIQIKFLSANYPNGIFYVVSMIFIMLSVALSAFVGRIRARIGPMPPIYKQILEKMGKVFFLCAPPVLPIVRTASSQGLPGPDKLTTRKSMSQSLLDLSVTNNMNLINNMTLQSQLNELNRRLITLEHKRTDLVLKKQENKPVFSEWILLGILFDRIFIILYLLCFMLNIIFFFPRSRTI